MNTKLTLSINKETVKRAKRISRKRGKSISKMVEEFLNSISERDDAKESPLDLINKIMKPYRKNTNLPQSPNYKEIIRQGRYEDYMKESEKRMKSTANKK